MDAVKIVNSAILGLDYKSVLINGKVYIITPPTIAKIAGSAYFLADLNTDNGNVFKLLSDIGQAAKALSFFIKGDESLYEELSNGTLDELVDGLSAAYSLVSTENFIKLSVLAKNVGKLTAKARPK